MTVEKIDSEFYKITDTQPIEFKTTLAILQKRRARLINELAAIDKYIADAISLG